MKRLLDLGNRAAEIEQQAMLILPRHHKALRL
jgi:hypothetical protein